MQRTRRHAPFIEQVRIAMSRRDHRRTPAANATLATRRRHHESEQMARWENEGGSIGHSAGQRRRSLP
jgi:hypothetical protein